MSNLEFVIPLSERNDPTASNRSLKFVCLS